MASIIVPLIETFAPEGVDLIVKLVEKLFGSKTGPLKKQMATSVVTTIGGGLVQIGKLLAPADPAAAAASAVQASVDRLNPAGVLQGTATVLTSADTTNKADLRDILQILKAIAAPLGAQ